MQNRIKSRSGYTMLEVLTIVAIIGILSAIAMQIYQKYQNKARNADVISAWENIDNSLMAYYASDLHQGEIVCQDMETVLPDHALENSYVNLSIGFDQTDPQQIRPVLNICANSSKPASFKVARLAHAYFQDLNRVGGGALLKDTLISFSVPLQGDMTCAAPIPAPSGVCLGTNTGAAAARPSHTPAPGNTQSQGNPGVSGPQSTTPKPPGGGPLTCGFAGRPEEKRGNCHD